MTKPEVRRQIRKRVATVFPLPSVSAHGQAQSRAEGHDTDLMHIEWVAWQEVCKELNRLGIDISQRDLLCGRLKEWGEWLAQLRREVGYYDEALKDAQTETRNAKVRLEQGMPV